VTIDELTPLLEAWYEVAPGGLGLGPALTAGVRNPTLRKFYAKLGKLAELDAPWWRVGGQDSFLPLHQLRLEDGLTVFGVENQGCFIIAAPDAAEGNVFGSGDGLADDRVSTLTDLQVPLEECIVTFVLRETVLTSEPLGHRTTPDVIHAAKAGRHYRGRYVDRDEYDDFWWSDEVLVMNIAPFDYEKLVARKGAWRAPPHP